MIVIRSAGFMPDVYFNALGWRFEMEVQLISYLLDERQVCKLVQYKNMVR